MMKKHVGIDVSKRFFDLHILEDNHDRHYDYTPQEVKKCAAWLARQEVALVVLEATGGYETALVAALQAAGLPVAVVNPRRIRDFAKAAGILAKTDKIDARTLARYGATLQPPAREKIDEFAQALRVLVARRNQLVDMRTAENNRLEHARDAAVRKSIRTIINALNKQIDQVEKQIGRHIEQQPQMKHKADILKTAPAIGKQTASMLVADLPELGRANRKEIAALVGAAPRNRDSGQFRGKRMTGGGRRHVRARLFMPTLVAIRHNPVIRKFYLHLLEQGKSKMTAIVACMRKLLVILNAMIKNNQPWQPKLA